MTKAKIYAVFGLTLRSDIELETLELSKDQTVTPQVEILRRKNLVRAAHPEDPHFDIQPDTQYFHWAAIGAYLIETDSRILVELHDDVSDLLASHALLGLVMSVLLERRGLLSLHASSVSVNGQAVVFLGDKGAGKSTTTGALLQRGHAPISDDLVPVDLPQDRLSAPLVYPAYSSTKLYPDSIEALGLQNAKTDREIHHSTVKMQKQMIRPVTKDATPIGMLCVLRRGSDVDHVHFEALPPHMGLDAIMRFTFKARYGETRMGRDSLIRHMKLCSGLVGRVPVFMLFVPNNMSGLANLAEAIEHKMLALP